MKIFFCLIILLAPIFFSSVPQAEENLEKNNSITFEKTLESKKCEHQPHNQQIDCNYKVGEDLQFVIAGIGLPDASIVFEKSLYEGDYYGSVGILHGCVCVKPGKKTLSKNKDMFFLSPLFLQRMGKFIDLGKNVRTAFSQNNLRPILFKYPMAIDVWVCRFTSPSLGLSEKSFSKFVPDRYPQLKIGSWCCVFCFDCVIRPFSYFIRDVHNIKASCFHERGITRSHQNSCIFLASH